MIEVLTTIFAGFACWYLNLVTVRDIGACLPVIEEIKAQWAEILATILALLLAARTSPPPPPEE